MEDDLNFQSKLEDDLNFKVNGRRPQFQGKQKTTSIARKLEDDLNLLLDGSQPQFLASASPELGTAQPQLVFIFFIDLSSNRVDLHLLESKFFFIPAISLLVQPSGWRN